MGSVWITPTLPRGTAGLVQAAVRVGTERIGVRIDDVAVKVKRHGVRRAWFTPCTDARCPLQVTPADYAEGAATGRGHLYARRGDLAHCRSTARIVPVDRTGHWVTGRAYAGVPRQATVPPGTRYLITLKVPQIRPAHQLPAERTYHRAKRAGGTLIEEPDDDLVLVLGHELQHVEQFRRDLPRSEVDAEVIGRSVLEAWVRAGRPRA